MQCNFCSISSINRRVIARGIRDLQRNDPSSMTPPPKNCEENQYWNFTGPKLYRYLCYY